MQIRVVQILSVIITLSYAALTAAEARPNEPGPPTKDRVLAIDVLLIPDKTMTQKAIAANVRLRENYPQGYTLGPDQAGNPERGSKIVP